MAWLSQPEAETLRLFLSETIKLEFERLYVGHWDKNGNDLSDVHRGQIKALREVYDIKEVLLNHQKQEAEKNKKEGA